jgi:V8-like Glu-specific endopeptidase
MMRTPSKFIVILSLFVLLLSTLVPAEKWDRKTIEDELKLREALAVVKLNNPQKTQAARQAKNNPFLDRSPKELFKMSRKSPLAQFETNELWRQLAAMSADGDLRTELGTAEELVAQARSVCLVGFWDDMEEGPNGKLSWKPDTAYPAMAQGEKFSDQSRRGVATAFVVGEDLLVTAGLPPLEDPKNLAFVFGFQVAGNTSEFDAEQVYRGAEIVKAGKGPRDFSIIRVDRTLVERPALSLAAATPAEESDIYWIGHPAGLPLKYSKGTLSLISDEGDEIEANLGLRFGNLGSPVFDESTGEVIGVLVQDNQEHIPYFFENGVRILHNPNADIIAEILIPSGAINQALTSTGD